MRTAFRRALTTASTLSPSILNPITGDPPMPEIYVHAVEGRSLDQKRALVKDITAAVVKHFGSPPEAVMVQIVESPKENKAKGGVLFSER
jgi:4-oxalocrotonate tautomerase